MRAAPSRIPGSALGLLAAVVGLLAAVVLGACSSTEPSGLHTDFVVAVGQERFVVRSTDPETIRLATLNFQGRNQVFPLGPLRRGDGGFNGPWSWHLDPAETRFVEAAIEVCDGAPSYVEANLDAFPTYCPWGGRVVSIRR
ncbi:MAG TPA: hypothetical protein VLI67_12205 [Vicinamibacteria bacterium]|nr:hypothetical protein [Vicinamibacteria bacterium]